MNPNFPQPPYNHRLRYEEYYLGKETSDFKYAYLSTGKSQAEYDDLWFTHRAGIAAHYLTIFWQRKDRQKIQRVYLTSEFGQGKHEQDLIYRNDTDDFYSVFTGDDWLTFIASEERLTSIFSEKFNTRFMSESPLWAFQYYRAYKDYVGGGFNWPNWIHTYGELFRRFNIGMYFMTDLDDRKILHTFCKVYNQKPHKLLKEERVYYVYSGDGRVAIWEEEGDAFPSGKTSRIKLVYKGQLYGLFKSE